MFLDPVDKAGIGAVTLFPPFFDTTRSPETVADHQQPKTGYVVPMTTEAAHSTSPSEDQIDGRHVSDLPDLITIDELSNYLQVPKQTIYYWQKIGSGPKPLKLGKHLRWNKRAVLDWLHELEVA